MKLVPEPESTEYAETTELNPVEKPAAPLTIPLAEKLPVGMIDGLKAIRHEIAQLHSFVVKEYNQVPSFLNGAYQAIEDAELFLKNVANGKEEYSPVPAKPTLKPENINIVDGVVKAPANLKDIPYMQEWASTFFFPTLRQLIGRTDIEVDVRGEMTKKKVAQIAIAVTTTKETVVLDTKFKANDNINMLELAALIKAL